MLKQVLDSLSTVRAAWTTGHCTAAKILCCRLGLLTVSVNYGTTIPSSRCDAGEREQYTGVHLLVPSICHRHHSQTSTILLSDRLAHHSSWGTDRCHAQPLQCTLCRCHSRGTTTGLDAKAAADKFTAASASCLHCLVITLSSSKFDASSKCA
jgi:hypothetical protein